MRTIVIGGGIAGLLAAKKLQATLISNQDHFVFLPRLPELLREQPPQTRLKLSECHDDVLIGEPTVDLENKRVILNKKKLSYDHLIIATGAKPNAPVPGTRTYAHNFYNYQEAQDLKTQVGDKRVVILGAGATGVELAMELAHNNHVTLLQRPEQILPHFSSHTRSYALKQLKEAGVQVRTNDACTRISSRSVVSENHKHPYQVAIWAGGVQANTPKGLPNKPIPVDEHLNVVGYNNAWAIGDCAFSTSPLTAQAAQQEALHVAKNIQRASNNQPLRPFHFHSKGDFLLLDGIAVMDSRITLKGRLPAFIRNHYYQAQIRRYQL